MDRHRQDWISNGCERQQLRSVDQCPKREQEDSGSQSGAVSKTEVGGM